MTKLFLASGCDTWNAKIAVGGRLSESDAGGTMGLSASVMCRCFVEGQTSPPPCPREWLEIDTDGELSLRAEHDSDRLWKKLEDWKVSCCPHPRMEAASEFVSNWPEYRLFQAALAGAKDAFPLLLNELPQLNGGLFPSERAGAALEELQRFASYPSLGTRTVLIDSATGEEMYEAVAAYEGIFLWSGRKELDAGLGEDDFFAVDARTEQVVFRARRFRQMQPDGSAVSAEEDDVVWENLETGERFEGGVAIPGKALEMGAASLWSRRSRIRHEYPERMHVERRPRSAAGFAGIVRALRAVFEASRETGQPVRWR